MKPYTDLLAALLTPTIALITTYIAIQQYRNNRLKQRLDLYDRRLAVYKSALIYIRDIVSKEGASQEIRDLFYGYIQESYFLFNKNMHGLLQEIYLKGIYFNLIERVQLPERKSEEDEEKAEALKLWLAQQYEILQKAFTPYLKLEAMK